MLSGMQFVLSVKRNVQDVHSEVICVYPYVFETAVPNKEGKQQDMDVPHPFIIEPPLDQKRRYGINDRLDFDLILIGRAVGYMPYLIFAFEEVGRVGVGKNYGQYKAIGNEHAVILVTERPSSAEMGLFLENYFLGQEFFQYSSNIGSRCEKKLESMLIYTDCL
jgi:hypothetical protein